MIFVVAFMARGRGTDKRLQHKPMDVDRARTISVNQRNAEVALRAWHRFQRPVQRRSLSSFDSPHATAI